MQQFFDKPETKAKMEEFQAQDEKLNNQFMAAANRVLSRRQSAAYKKMLGAPFDLAQLRGGPGRRFGGGGRNGNGNQADAAKAGSASPAPATNPDAPQTTSTTKPRRKSLRELRGVPEKSD
jgi:hypothetical protein